MSKEIIWVPKTDGKTWNSSRTRDLVDLAFTIERQSTGHAMITIRCSKNSDENGRARTVIGRVYADDVPTAKKFVQNLVNDANTLPTQEAARNRFVQDALAFSLVFSPAGRPLNPGVVVDGVWCDKAALGMTTFKPPVATPETSEVEDLSAGGWLVPPTEEDLSRMSVSMCDLVDEPSVEVPTSGIYKVDPETESWAPWSEIADELNKSIEAKRAAIAMKETVEAVMDTASPVVDPEPVAEVVTTEAPQFITINGKQIPITWPK